MKVNWVSNYSFEPSVANKLLQRMAAREADHLSLMFDTRLVSAEKTRTDGRQSWQMQKARETTIHAKVLIDGTEFGDVARMTGVGYDLGMENGKITGEDIAPDSAYNIVQDMTMVAILKDYGPDADMTIPMPGGYNREEFIHTCVQPPCSGACAWAPGFFAGADDDLRQTPERQVYDKLGAVRQRLLCQHRRYDARRTRFRSCTRQKSYASVYLLPPDRVRL